MQDVNIFEPLRICYFVNLRKKQEKNALKIQAKTNRNQKTKVGVLRETCIIRRI